MDDVAQCLCRTLRVHAAQGSLVLQVHHRRTAGGADRGHSVGFNSLCMMGDPDDLRDDIARFAHLNGVPDAQPELSDEVLVVEGGAGYRSTCQKHRVKAGGGGKHAGAPHSHLDAAQGGLLDLRRVLEGNGPAREFVGRTHQLPLRKIVHLDNGTVHVKIQLGAVLPDVLNLGNGVLDIMHHMVARRYRQAKAFEVIQTFGVLGQGLAPDLLHIEHKDRKPTAAGDAGVLLPQRTGCCVAGIFKGCCTLQFLLGAQVLKGLVGHIYLAAHLQKLRCVFKGLGDAADGAHVCGNILAHHAVTAGGGADKLSILILQAAGKAIDLDLYDILRLYSGLADAAVEVPQLVKGKCIQQAFHLNGMGHLGQLATGGSAYLLGGRCRCDQLGKLCFQFLQFPRQGIVFKILQLWRILIVVKPVVFLNNCAQFFHTLFCLFQFQIFHSPAISFCRPPCCFPGRNSAVHRTQQTSGSRLHLHLP